MGRGNGSGKGLLAREPVKKAGPGCRKGKVIES